MAIPERAALRTELQDFDDIEKKVVGGMLAVMFGQPAKIRDREWMSEQFTQVALLTGQFEDVEHAHDGVERAQEWLRNGAKPSETVHSIFKRQGVYTEDLERSKLAGKVRRRPGRKKATETSKRRVADKAARAERKTARRNERVAAARAAKAAEASSDDE